MATAQYKITDFTLDDPATLKAKIDGNYAVLARRGAGYQCYAAAVPDMTVKVAAGGLFVAGAVIENAIQTSGAIVAPVGNPRIDRVVLDQLTGVASVVAGTPAGVPVPPAVPAGKIPIAQISLVPATVAITNALITDEWSILTGQVPFIDSSPVVVGSADPTKKVRFGVDGNTTGTTRVLTVQDSDQTLVGRTTTDTLTNKTLTSPAVTNFISFPASQVASAGANDLDDYEEGTWTPSLGGTTTYTARAGTYTKIGRLVSINSVIQISTIGTGSTTDISGLPFTAGPDAAVSFDTVFNSATAIVSASGRITAAGSTITVHSRTGASASDGTNPIFQTSTIVIFSATYSV